MRHALVALALVTSSVLGLAGCGGSGTTSSPYANVDVVVGSRNSNALLIWRDAAAAQKVAADVVIESTTGWANSFCWDGPEHAAYEANWLAVATRDCDRRVCLWNNFATMTDNQEPAVVLALNDQPHDVQLVAGNLYVASSDDVYVWRDVATLSSFDSPDVVISGFCSTRNIAVQGDVLFVGEKCGDTDRIAIVAGLSALSGSYNQGTVATTRLPVTDVRRMVLANGTLWAYTRNSAVYGWSNAASVADGSLPDRLVTGGVWLDDRGAIAADANNLYLSLQEANNQGEVCFQRVALTGPVLLEPAATVAFGDVNIEDTYGLSVAGDVLVGCDRERDFAFVYPNASRMRDGAQPAVWLVDPRMNSPREPLVIAR